MRCDGCGRVKPTRFVIFGKAVGMLLASTWEVRPADLCEPCLRTRFRKWTGLTAALGWWGAHAFGHALRFIPGNIMEFRRAMRLPPLPAEPADQELAEATAERTRLLLLHRATSRVFYGGAGVLVGVLFLGGLVVWPSAEWNTGRTLMLVIGAAFLVIGGGVVASGVSLRRATARLTHEELVAAAASAAPPPRARRTAGRSARGSDLPARPAARRRWR